MVTDYSGRHNSGANFYATIISHDISAFDQNVTLRLFFKPLVSPYSGSFWPSTEVMLIAFTPGNWPRSP